MTHDPLCPMGQSLTTLTSELCLCTVIAGVRDDERTKNDREGMWVDGYESALNDARDAVGAVPPIDQRVDDNGFIGLVYDKGEVIAAIDGLRKEASDADR